MCFAGGSGSGVALRLEQAAAVGGGGMVGILWGVERGGARGEALRAEGFWVFEDSVGGVGS